MRPRPEDLRFATDLGVVREVYEEEWEVDVETMAGAVIRRATVVGSRMPEKSTAERPQWVHYGWFDHSEGAAWARAVNRELVAERDARGNFLYYEEAGLFRITVSREGVFEVRCRNGKDTDGDAPLYRLRIDKADGVLQLDTPSTSLRLREGDASADLTVEGNVTINCVNATVTASGTALVKCDDIKLGEPAIEAAVKGNTLMSFYNLVKLMYDGHTHQDSGAGVPTVPLLAWLPQILSQVVKLK